MSPELKEVQQMGKAMSNVDGLSNFSKWKGKDVHDLGNLSKREREGSMRKLGESMGSGLGESWILN
jgi:hypothetical protein